jgi:hypothetical protein
MIQIKKTLNNILHTLKYAVPLVITGFMAQEIAGQDIDWWEPYPLPKEPINFFISQDNTPQSLEYNALKTKAERDNIIIGKELSDITGTVTGDTTGTWNCNKTTPLFVFNSHDWGDSIYKSEDHPVYNWYNGDDRKLIIQNEGTIKYSGTLGIPTYSVEVDTTHEQNIVMTGDSIVKGIDWNFIEAAWPWNQTNIKPGEVYLPTNTNYIMIYYDYVYKDDNNRTTRATIPAVLFEIVDSKYKFVATNPYVKIIMERDTTKPEIKTWTDANNTVHYEIIDKNFKNGHYVINNDTTKFTNATGTINTNGLSDGTYNITIEAKDYFRLEDTANTSITINFTGIDDLIDNSISKVYPNPAIDKLNIAYDNSVKIDKILFTNIMGVIFKLSPTYISDNLIEFNLIGLPTGFYLISVQGDKTLQYKFLKY